MTKDQLLRLAILDDRVTKEDLADALDSVLPYLEREDNSFTYWRSGQEFAAMKEVNGITFVERNEYGVYEFNGGSLDSIEHIISCSPGDLNIVSLSEWVAAIREAFELETL